MFQVSLREPYLFDLPIGAGGSGLLVHTVFIPTGTSGAAAARFRWDASSAPASTPTAALRAEEVDFFGYRTPAPAPIPGRQRRPRSCLDQVPASGSTTATTRSWPPRVSTPSSPPSRAGAHSPGPSSTPRGAFTSPPAAARTAPASSSSPCGATSASRPRRLRSTKRYFAGNFGSLRGFQYRTVSPHAFGVPTGGVMMAAGLGRVPVSLERPRHFPSDHLHRLRHGQRQLQFHTKCVSRSAPAHENPPDGTGSLWFRPRVPDAYAQVTVFVLQFQHERDVLTPACGCIDQGYRTPDSSTFCSNGFARFAVWVASCQARAIELTVSR